MHLRKLITRSFKDSSGAAMIEAALILPIFLFLTFAIIEVGLILFYAFVLESAMYDTTRFAKIADDRNEQVQKIRDLIGERSLGLIPVEEVIITTDLQVNFAANWQNAPAEKCDNGGTCPCGNDSFIDDNGDGLCNIGPAPLELDSPGSLVSFVAFYKKPIVTPFLDSLVNQEGGRFLISSGTITRNEPSAGP
jgi:Flp pilus assembly protein TadG